MDDGGEFAVGKDQMIVRYLPGVLGPPVVVAPPGVLGLYVHDPVDLTEPETIEQVRMSNEVSESYAEIQRGNAGQSIVVIARLMNDDPIDVVAGKDVDGEVSIAKGTSRAEIVPQRYLGVPA